MSLGVSLLEVKPTEVYSANITHNLNEMAEEAGIYKYLWRPEEVEVTQAKELIKPLEWGLTCLKAHPEVFREFDSPNGYGVYEDFVPWLEKYIEACKQHPEAVVSVSR